MNKPQKSIFKKISQAALYIGSALLIPLNVSLPKNEKGKRDLEISFPFGKAAIFGLVYGVIQPLSLFLFPRAETFAKKEGLDPSIIQTVTSAKDIRVIPDNLAGKTYYLFNHPPLLQPVQFGRRLHTIFNDNIAAFHDVTSPGYIAKAISPGVKKIYMKDTRQEKIEFQKVHKEWVEIFSDSLLTYKAKLSPQSKYLYTFIHELRHTDRDNLALTPLKCEGDADYYAARQLSIFLKQPNLAQAILDYDLYLGSSTDTLSAKTHIHDTGLYAYLKHTNQPIPSEDALIKANVDAAPVIKAFNDIYFSDDPENAEAQYKEGLKKLSPLAGTKVELYKKAFFSLLRPTKIYEEKKLKAAAFNAS